MLSLKKSASVVLVVAMGISMNVSAFAQTSNKAFASGAPQQVENSSTALDAIEPVSGVHTRYWDSHDVKFEFHASADVVYDANSKRYFMTGVTASRPSITIRAFSGANATITEPTLDYTDGGRTAILTSTATIQNKTGYSDVKTIKMYLYCEGHSGELVLQML